MKWPNKFLKKIITCLVVATLVFSAAHAAGNLPGAAGGDIGDYGAWTTPNNREQITGAMSRDLDSFQSEFQTQVIDNYVPIEAKVGIAFINGMAYIGRVLDGSLVRFMTIFILIMFIFWVSFEAYQIITGTTEIKKSIEGIVKKGGMIAIWLIVLQFGAAQIFMWVMGPIITIGTYTSDLILTAVTSTAGASLPDTCGAIREYAATHVSNAAIVDANAAADLICLPTRLSGFFYTAVAVGFKWMLLGIGFSALTFLAGAIFVVVFLILIWKFALLALGVIADLFLAVFMLPFTAVAETIGQTSYKGIAGNIFNGFLKIFNAESLSTQIGRFINAALFFVSYSIVIAVCAALMTGIIDVK